MGAGEQSMEQTLIPQAYLGRVISACGMAIMPIGSLAGGFLANQLGPGPLYVLVGAAWLVLAAAMLASPTIRAAQVGDPS